MLTLKLKDYQVEFSFTDYFSKKIIHSESFDLDDAEQIALDLLKMIKDKRKKDAQEDRNESRERTQKRCF